MIRMSTQKLLHPHRLFKAIKYTVYIVLMANVYLFLQEETAAASKVFSNGLSLSNVIQAFAATIDTAAWLVLLVIFELETAVVNDQKLSSAKWKYSLMAVKALCYGFVLYAFYGYLNKMLGTYRLDIFPLKDACALIGQGFSTIVSIDNYPALNTENCLRLQEQTVYQLQGTQVLGSESQWLALQRLAWVDVINAFAWLGVVVILEADVWLQLRNRLRGWIARASQLIKGVLYSILFLAAVYWGVLGDFLDFWDAFMWLFAFVFIEMNLFQWQEESKTLPETTA